MRGYDRRPRWKQAVYAPRAGMTDGCRVLLLRLLDSMEYDGVVSVPRTKLAADLGVAPARVSERVKLARAHGFLAIIEHPRPNVTAVYQATIPDTIRGTDSVPHGDEDEVQNPVSIRGTDSVPLNNSVHAQTRYACTPPIVRTTDARDPATTPDANPHNEKRADKKQNNKPAPALHSLTPCSWCKGPDANECKCLVEARTG